MKFKEESLIYDKISSLKYRKTVNDNGLVIDMISGNLLELDSIGYEIFLKIDGKNRLIDIINYLIENYDASHNIILSDTLLLINKLLDANFIIKVN